MLSVGNVAFLVLSAALIIQLKYAYAENELPVCSNGAACGERSLPDLGTDELLRKLFKQSTDYIVKAWPFLQPAGLSGLGGYVFGLILRKLIIALVLFVALLGTTVQVLVYTNWVSVHWDRISEDMTTMLGGDRLQVVSKGGPMVSEWVVLLGEAVMSQGVPSVAGFAAGMALAFLPGLALV